MNEVWSPLWQGADNKGTDRVFFGDLRLMGDDDHNREFNFGTGYRQYLPSQDAVAGGLIWFDRRQTEHNSTFHQITLGGEYLADAWDLRVNGYVPLSGKEKHLTGPAPASDPYLADTGIYYDTGGQNILVEEPQKGLDLELGFKVPFTEAWTDSTRIYGAAYHFYGDQSEDVTGWRTRIASDITPDIQLGARFQRDDERGSQGFLEATIRFPFNKKQSFRDHGARARLDESPERDIDIVAGAQATSTPNNVSLPVINEQTGHVQRVIYVDNSATGGGNGSKDTPFNTLAAAQAALQDNDILYIARGNDTNSGMENGLLLARTGVQVIGEGTAFVFDGGRLNAGNNSATFTGKVLRAAGAAPVISNVSGDGVTVTGSDILLSGLTIDGAQRHGIYAVQNGGASLDNLTIRNVSVTSNGADGILIEGNGAGTSVTANIESVTASDNKNGVRFYAHNNASVTGSLQSSAVTANDQHGVIVYDDSIAGSVDVDLGGGTRSAGLNAFYGNRLEELSVDIDGGTLMAQNNWWGQSSGIDQDNPAIGIAPQIYYGAPINDGLVVHYTFDEEWMNGNTMYDRSGNEINTISALGGISAANMTDCEHRQCLLFDALDDRFTFSSPLIPTTQISVVSLTRLQNNINWYNLVDNTWGNHAIPRWTHMTNSAGRAIFGFWGTGIGGQRLAMTASNTVLPNAWSHLAGTYNGTTIKSYVNGGTPGTLTYANITFINTLPITLGEVGGNAGYMSYLQDDVRIYNRALTDQEVQELYRMDTTSRIDTSAFLNSSP